MSFRKRNVIINSRGLPGSTPPAPHPSLAAGATATTSSTTTAPAAPPAPPLPPPPGIRPSPINGQPTTSTGTPSLDGLLAGHAGLPLGCSLLIEEPGTTDYGGALLRYYAAEGIVQGHAVIVVGVGEGWIRELPAVVGDAEAAATSSSSRRKDGAERMKIAWRYERLGEFGSGLAGSSRAHAYTPPRAPDAAAGTDAVAPSKPVFCHSFDLTKRLTIPSTANLTFIAPPSPAAPRTSSPYLTILTHLTAHLANTPPHSIHRIVIPSLLNPALYPPHASLPQHLLQFFHSLRALLRAHARRLTVMISLPTELFPRDTGLVRWVEILSDGVVELLPLPRRTAAKAGQGQEEPQGLVRLWKLPVLGEKGGGVGAALGAGEDLAFLVTRKRFEIMAYSLPPAEGEEEEVQGERRGVPGKATKVDIEF